MENAIIAYRTDWLAQSFFRRKSPARALRRFLKLHKGKNGARKLLELLGHHEEREGGYVEPEVHHRDEFDFLLAYYSLRELAAVINYVPIKNDSSLAHAETVLNDPAIRLYSEKHYPLLLPAFARERIAGRWSCDESETFGSSGIVQDHVVGVFEEFVQLLRRRYADREIDTFLWFVDDGYLEGESLADTFQEIKDPKEIECAFSLSYRDRSHTQDSIIGFVRFVRYSQQLLWLLHQLPKDSLIQSGLWHFHAYWFTQMSHDFLKVLARVGRIAQLWAETDAVSSPADGRNRMMEDIDRLFDPAFGQAYLAAAKDMLDRRLASRIERDMNRLGKRRGAVAV